VAAATPVSHLIEFTVASSLLSLLILGGVSAKVGGANVVTAALRVALWSALAMAVTAGVGALWGRAI
jgi:VIT1/CCC1 family predicted Fe2+/Mn2+ transporter